MRPHHLFAATLAAAALAGSVRAAFIVSTYTGPDGGSWNVAGNWSPFGIPNDGANTYHAIVTGGLDVTMDGAVAITQLSIGAGSALAIANDVDPALSGDMVANNGTISLLAVGNATVLQLNSPDVTFSGTGALEGTNQNAIIQSIGTNRRLTNLAGHTIRGSLNLGAMNSFLSNGGVIEATDPDGLTIQVIGAPTQNFNTGVLRAGSGATLTVLGSGIDCTGGIIYADGGTVALNNSFLLNPTFLQAGGGQLSLVGSSTTLSNPTVAFGATLVATNDNDPVVTGTVANQGTFLLDAAGNTTGLQLNSDVTFTGTGSLEGSNQFAVVFSIGVVRRLTNDISHAIRGSMNVGGANTLLTNLGLIEATDPDGLTIDLGGATTQNFNTGTLRAGPGATLAINDSAFDNSGGTILADGGTVNVIGSTIDAAFFQQTGGGQFNMVGTSNTLIDPAIDASTTLRLPNDADTVLQGIVDNGGTIDLDAAGNTTSLQLNSGEVQFTGGGSVQGTNQNALAFSIGVVRRLVNAADHAFRGSMSFGGDNTLLTNFGLIEATDPDGMTVNLTGSTAQNFNVGTMRAGAGSTLGLLDSAFDCAGGVIIADEGAVTINNCAIVDAFLTRLGAGTITLLGSPTFLIDPTIDAGTTVTVANDNDPVLEGSVTNAGTIMIDAAGNGTLLQLNTAEVHFTGGGEVAGTNQNAAVFSTGAVRRLVNAADHAFRGSISIGLGNTLLTNEGLIEATDPDGVTIDLAGSVAQNFNPGTLRAGPGSTLAIFDTALDSTGGEIRADGGTVTVNSSELTGGTLAASGGGVSLVGGSSTLRDLAIAPGCTVTVVNDNDPALQNTIVNDGVISVEAAGNGTVVQLNSPIVTLAGSGEMRGTNQNCVVQSAVAIRRLVNGPSHVIRGSWALGASNSDLTNEGAIVADSAAGMTIDVSSDFQNAGVLLVSDEGSLVIQPGTFVQSGSFLIEDGQTATRFGGAIQQTAGLTQVDGLLTMDGPLNVTGGIVGGLGTIATTLLNNSGGTIAPGGIGTLEVGGPVTFGASATFDVQVAGPPGSGLVDELASTGNATLAGTLIATRAGAFAPLPTDEFTVLTAAARLGTFDSVQSCEPVAVIYGDTFVKVRFPTSSGVEGDLNGDGLVNGVDLGLLLSAWGPCLAVCCLADFNDDGVIDGADLGVVLANWT